MDVPLRRRRARAQSPATCSSPLVHKNRPANRTTLSAYACWVGLLLAATETTPTAEALPKPAGVAFVTPGRFSISPPTTIAAPWTPCPLSAVAATATRHTATLSGSGSSSNTRDALTALGGLTVATGASSSSSSRRSRTGKWKMYCTPREPGLFGASGQLSGYSGKHYSGGGGGVTRTHGEGGGFGLGRGCLGSCLSPVRGGGSGGSRGNVYLNRQSAGRRGATGGWARHMSMMEGEGGGSSEDNGAVVSAVAFAGLAAILYGLQHSQEGGAQASLESIVDLVKAGPSMAGSTVQAFLSDTFDKVADMGSLGPLYFGAIYIGAEILAIPALPFTAAAGYLFGVTGGTAVVLISATIAAGFSFLLGRTLLRRQVESILQDNPKFMAIDKAIGKEGFKIILLLRLSPIFPFALSNYLYGVTAVGFPEYMMGTMLGFFPGTLAYVYGGMIGKALTDGGGSMSLPWYGYAAGAVVVAAILKTVGDIATNAVEELEPGIKED